MQTIDARAEFQGGYTLRIPEVRWLVVHHAAALYRQQTGIEDLRAVARYHTQTRGWPGTGYTKAIAEVTNGGEVACYDLSDPLLQRAHVWGRNHEAVGVSCLTNFTGVPEDKWIEALALVLADWKQRWPRAQIVGHTDITLPGHGTACPGPAWPLWRPLLLDRVSALLRPAPAPSVALTRLRGALAIDEHLPIMGPPIITQRQALAYLTRRPTGHYTAADLRDEILPVYGRWCEELGVSFGVAVAQMAHETGRLASHWSQRPQRNPAGVGVTGRSQRGAPAVPPPDPRDGTAWTWNPQRRQWETGLVFASWAEGVPAQVARLMGYARTDGQLTEGQLRALRQHTSRRPLPAAARGSAETIRELGAAHNRANVGLPRERWRAGWAWPGELYGNALAAVLRAMAEETP